MLLICPIIAPLAKMYSFWFQSVPVFAEGQVEHQKQNQRAIEKWPFGFAFGIQLGIRQTRALIKTYKNIMLQVEQSWDK